jgi:hypothetical protein
MQGNVASAPHLRRIGTVVSIGSVGAILLATLIPASGQTPDSHLCLVCGTSGGVDFILNVLLFIPLGVGLALSGVPWKRAALTACALSLTVETTQFFFISGRDATLGDVVTNTIGGIVGYELTRNLRIWLQPAPGIAAILCLGWCAVWLAIQSVSSFAFAVSEPDSKYYGQIARQLRDFAVFPGRELDASIGDLAITDTELRNTESIRARLLDGAIVAVTVQPGGVTSNIAPILRVADNEEREILLLAQDKRDLVFGVRTGAAILRFRPPFFAMMDAFPSGAGNRNSSAAGALALSGRYNGWEAQLTAREGSMTHGRRVSVSSSLGWTLALPFQWFIEDTRTEQVVSMVWMACLLVPLGYWGAHITRTIDRRANALVVALCFAAVGILVGGLVLVRHTFGLPADPIGDWIASVSGILVGGVLASRSGKAADTWKDSNRSAALRNSRAVTSLDHNLSNLEFRVYPSRPDSRNLVSRTTRPLSGHSFNSTLR